MSKRASLPIRHPALQPFSRDHHYGLVQARRLRRSIGGSAEERQRVLEGFHRAWTEEIEDHFDCEERWLLRHIPDARERMRLLHDHSRLRDLAQRAATERSAEDPDPDVARELGEMLHDHIRWEERVLFPAIERAADPADLDALAPKTGGMEARKGRRSRRG